jgi:hypothetical protein
LKTGTVPSPRRADDRLRGACRPTGRRASA